RRRGRARLGGRLAPEGGRRDRVDHARGRGAGPRRGARVGRIVNGRSAQRSLGSIVLGFESIVVLLGALVLFGLRRLDPVVALVGGGALFVVVLATIGLLRFRWAFAIGWLVQAVVLAAGFLEPTF